ncbi:hypothetical protein HY625_00785 [Candidatus Uhrbacteria bacterium]|nr:hypothetical protein [Candidatus Uhrbacteria bacterium]
MQYVIRFFPPLLQIFFAVFLILFLGAFLRKKELPPRLARWGFFCSIFLFLVRGILYSIEQYRAWSVNPLSRHFLPPEEPFYFFRYSFFHFFSGFFLSLFVALLLLVVFWALQLRSHGRWLDTNERLLVFFGALAAGWPGAILYAVGVFLLPLLATPWLLQKSPALSKEEISPNPPLEKGGDSPPFQKEGEGGFPDHRRRVRLAPFIIISALLTMGLTQFIIPHAPWLSVLICNTCL